MRSVPQAMIWEMWRHGRWSLLAGLLAANALPFVLFAALRHDGAVDPREPSQIVMHIVLVQINMFIFAAGLWMAQGKPARLYALPVANSTLVAWHLAPMMAAVALESAMSAAALNAVFDLGWPVWGPAIFAAVTLAAVTASLWLAQESGWSIVALMIVPGGLAIWFKARYGNAFSPPTRLWHEVTLSEGATLLAVAGLAYYVGRVAVSRSRRGDPPPSLGIIAWLDRLLDPPPYSGPPFRSAAEAQFWFEWRKKGLAMPVAVGAGLVLGIAIWLLVSREANDLMQCFLVGGGMLSVAALIGGMIMGNCGPDDANYEMGSFLASRPMTNVDMARTILKAAVKSLLIAWLIWAASFLLFYLTLLAARVPMPALPRELSEWYFPATLIGAWTVMSVLTSAGLTGRARLVVKLLCGLLAGFIGVTSFVRLALPREIQDPFLQGVLALVATLLMLATVWVFAAARRRKLIGWPMVYVAASLWAALGAVMAVADVWQVCQRPALFLALAAVCALSLAPLAAGPLALAWNRNR